MINRRRLLKLACVAPIPALLGWLWQRTPKPTGAADYVIIHQTNVGTEDEHTTVRHITYPMAINKMGGGIGPTTPPEHIHRCNEWVATPEGKAWLRSRIAR